jgi:hypothetical protein
MINARLLLREPLMYRIGTEVLRDVDVSHSVAQVLCTKMTAKWGKYMTECDELQGINKGADRKAGAEIEVLGSILDQGRIGGFYASRKYGTWVHT